VLIHKSLPFVLELLLECYEVKCLINLGLVLECSELVYHFSPPFLLHEDEVLDIVATLTIGRVPVAADALTVYYSFIKEDGIAPTRYEVSSLELLEWIVSVAGNTHTVC